MIEIELTLLVNCDETLEEVLNNVKSNIRDAIGNAPYEISIDSCTGREIEDIEE